MFSIGFLYLFVLCGITLLYRLELVVVVCNENRFCNLGFRKVLTTLG